MDGHKKPLIGENEIPLILHGYPSHIQKDFDKLFIEYGYDCELEKALYCPCRNRSTGQPLPHCKNCMGTGWFFINKTKTRLVVQNVNKNTEYKDWTETDRGMANVIARNIDRLSFMDRITVLDLEVTFNQILRVQNNAANNTLYAYLYYYPLEIEYVYLFDGADNKLMFLEPDVHYTIVENRIILDNSLSSKFSVNLVSINEDGEYLSISIRYKHNPQYCVVDIPREATRRREKECATGDRILNNLPISAMVRKTHFIIDAPNYFGESVYDNTVYPL